MSTGVIWNLMCSWWYHCPRWPVLTWPKRSCLEPKWPLIIAISAKQELFIDDSCLMEAVRHAVSKQKYLFVMKAVKSYPSTCQTEYTEDYRYPQSWDEAETHWELCVGHERRQAVRRRLHGLVTSGKWVDTQNSPSGVDAQWPLNRFHRAGAAQLDGRASHLDLGLSKRPKVTYSGGNHEYPWGGVLQLPRHWWGHSVEGHPAAPSLLWRSRRYLLPRNMGKRGFWCHFRKVSLLKPVLLHPLQQVWGIFGNENRRSSQSLCWDTMVFPHLFGGVNWRVVSSSTLGSHLCPHHCLLASTCWVSPVDFYQSFLCTSQSAGEEVLCVSPWKNFASFPLSICMSMARRTCLGFHHTVLQLLKLFITGSKTKSSLSGLFCFFFSPFSPHLSFQMLNYGVLWGFVAIHPAHFSLRHKSQCWWSSLSIMLVISLGYFISLAFQASSIFGPKQHGGECHLAACTLPLWAFAFLLQHRTCSPLMHLKGGWDMGGIALFGVDVLVACGREHWVLHVSAGALWVLVDFIRFSPLESLFLLTMPCRVGPLLCPPACSSVVQD